MADLELCAAISDAFGPSGYEKEAVDVIGSLGGLAAHRDSMQGLYALCRRMWATSVGNAGRPYG
ncbi:MAG: hypothetical protein ACLR7U_08990 [Ruthenibacterium lactatiformans]